MPTPRVPPSTRESVARYLRLLARAAGLGLLLVALHSGFQAWLAPDHLLAWLGILGFCG